jgi:hypothetical protein
MGMAEPSALGSGSSTDLGVVDAHVDYQSRPAYRD